MVLMILMCSGKVKNYRHLLLSWTDLLKKIKVLDLQYLDAEQSQRVVDFLSGATHALDGHQQRIGQGVFIFAPSNFTINSESQEARELKDAFWGRNKEKEQQMTMSTSQYQYSEPVKKSSIF